MPFGAQELRGPTEFFDGAMAAVITRKVKVIHIIEDAVFTTLTMQWPQTPASAGAAVATSLSFPGYFQLWDVASFRLLSGSIQVVYHTNT